MSRYSRQEILPEVGAHGQRQLASARVAIIGLGGLGCAAAPYLAGAGIGELVLVDGDRVELSNLARQTLHGEADVGRHKADSAAAALAALNSEITLRAHRQRADDALLAQLAADCDLLLDCSDNFPTRQAVNRACVAQGCALVSGAAIRWEGQLFVAHPGRGNSPCYACLYGHDEGGTESCEQAGIAGPLVGAIGSLQALAALRLLLGRGQAGWLWRFDAADGNWRKWSVPRDPDCPVCASRH